MRADAAERARAGGLPVQPPHLRERRVGDPLLQVAGAEVADPAELARLDQLARQPQRRHEAVVEPAHRRDAGRRHRLPHRVGLVGRAAERLLADHGLARLGGGHDNLGVQAVRPARVDQADAQVAEQVAPVGVGLLEAVAVCGGGNGRLVAPGDGNEPRPERRRPGHVRDRLVGVRVRLAHEGVADQADADLLDRLRAQRDAGGTAAARPRRRPAGRAGGAGALAHCPLRCIAASKASFDAGKSERRTNSTASRAPNSRSMPESSHSMLKGPA